MPRLAGILSFNKGLGRLKVSRQIFPFIFVFLTFLVTYRVMLITLLNPVQIALEFIYELMIVLYIAYRIALRAISRNWRVNALEALMGLVFVLPFLAGFAALDRFGQPLIYGVGTFRDFYLIYGGLIIYNMLRQNVIDIKLVENAVVGVAWFNLIAYYMMSLLTDPSVWLDTGIAGSNELKGEGVFYRFNMVFMYFGSIYYVIKAVKKNRDSYLIYAALFLIYIVFFRLDRTVMLVVVGAIGAFFLFSTSLKKLTLMSFKYGLPLILLATVSYVFFSDVYDRYATMIVDVFNTVSASQTAGSGSDNIRIYEFQQAIDGIKDNPWFGNGKVSQQWKEGGYNYFLGYFFASDLGIIGLLYIYGIIGTVILYLQFPFSFWYSLKIKYLRKDIFLLTMQYMMLALFVDSFSNGYPAINAAQSFSCAVLIYYYYQMDQRMGIELHSESSNPMESE